MERIQADKLRRAAEQDEELRSLFEYYRDHKASYTELSVRGVVQGTFKRGLKIGQPKAREFLTLLVEAGVGRGVKDEANNISNIKKMVAPTKELGAIVAGDSKNLRRYTADRKARNLDGAANMVKGSSDGMKVYPYRQAGNISITLTINGKPVTMPLPDHLEPEELAALIKRLRQAEDRRGA